MQGYLGETPVDIKDSPYAKYKPADWAMLYIEKYGHIDGEHHKQWVFDQVARILKGAPIKLTVAKWSNGHEEYRHSVGTSDKYENWVREMRGDYDEENDEWEYGYDEGTPP